jgi:exosortase
MASALAMENDRRSRLTAWTLVLSACAMSVVFLWPTWESLAGFWFGVNRYAHGPLIVGVFVYLLIHSRDRLQSSLPEPFLAALLPLGFLLCVWLVAVLASVQAIHQIMLPVILWTTFLVLLGWPIAKRLILPTAYLYLAIPVWESGNFILQWLTVKAVSVGLSVLSVPFLVDGNTISLPAGTFSVDDRCSGLHYLTVAIAISVLYALLWLKSNRNRVLLIALAILLALVTNWIRVFSVVYAGYLTDMQHYLRSLLFRMGALLHRDDSVPVVCNSNRKL